MIKSKELQPRLPNKAFIENRRTNKEFSRQEKNRVHHIPKQYYYKKCSKVLRWGKEVEGISEKDEGN